MGLASSQARMLALVSRNADLELQAQYVGQRRLQVANAAAGLFNTGAGLFNLNTTHDTELLREQILQWLWPANSEKTKSDWQLVGLEPAPDVNRFLNSADFEKWKHNKNSLIVVDSGSRSGKAVSVGAVVKRLKEELPKTSNSALAYHYFRAGSQLGNSQLSLLRSIARQLVAQAGMIPPTVLALHKNSDGQNDHKTTDILDMIQSLAGNFAAVYILVDSLEDCRDLDDLITVLEYIHGWDIGSLHILLTGQVDHACENSILHANKANLPPSDSGTSSTANTPRWLQLDLQSTHDVISLENISAEILSLRSIPERELATNKATLSAVNDFEDAPSSIERTLVPLVPSIRFEIRKILHLLAFSIRPVSLDEIYGMLNTETNSETRIECEISHNRISTLLDICRPLISISSPKTNPQNLFWATTLTKTYLTSSQILKSSLQDFGISAQAADLALADLCIEYLLLFDDQQCPSAEYLNRFPFARYAAQFWVMHAFSAQRDSVPTLGTKLFQNRTAHLNSMRIFDPEWPQAEPAFARPADTIPGPLYCASLAGLENCVRDLLKNRRPTENFEGLFGNPLQAAAAGGHVGVVRALLSSNVKVNAECGCYGNALCAATGEGHELIVKMLLRAGADVNLTGANFSQMIYQSKSNSWLGEEGIARDVVNTIEESKYAGPFGNAILMASYEGHPAVVKALIGAGADLDIRDSQYGRTPLLWAVAMDRSTIVEILLKAGADPNAADSQGITSLQVAVENNQSEAIDLLLQYEAELSPKSIDAAFKRLMTIDPSCYKKEKKLTARLKGKGFQSSAVEVLLKLSPVSKGDKLVLRKCYTLQGNTARSFRRYLMRERDVLRSFDHPNVVKFLGYRENNQKKLAYLYMEYCNGGDLGQFSDPSACTISTGGQTTFDGQVKEERAASYESDTSSSSPSSPTPQRHLSQVQAWNILVDMASALAYCHHGLVKNGPNYSLKPVWRQVLHRDIKPANVVLTYYDGIEVAKLCDLGLAKVRDDVEKQTVGLGTLEFMPPEVRYDLQPWSAKGDCFSLGATMKILAKQFECQEWDHLIDQCTQSLPTNRPSSLIILQTARLELSRLRNTESILGDFLIDQAKGQNYIQRALLDLLGRFYRIFKGIKLAERQQLARRIQWLHQDMRGIDLYHWTFIESVHLAVLWQDREMLRTLFEERNFDSETECSWDCRGMTPLHLAAQDADVEMVKLLLRGSRNNDNVAWLRLETRDDDGETALHLIAAKNSTETMHLLLSASELIRDIEDNLGRTPLLRAAADGHEEVLRVLIEAGADPVQTSSTGLTAQSIASEGKHFGVVNYLQETRWGRSSELLQDRISRLESVDKELEMHLRRSDSQREVVLSEMKSIQEVIGRNIESSFKMMG